MMQSEDLILKNGIGKFRSPKYYVFKKKPNIYLTQVYKSNFGFLESFFHTIEINNNQVTVKFLEAKLPFIINKKNNVFMESKKSYFASEILEKIQSQPVDTEKDNHLISDFSYVKRKIKPLLLLIVFTDGTYLFMEMDVKIKDNKDVCVVDYCTNREQDILFEEVQ